MGKHLKTPVSLRLDEEEIALLEALAKKYGGKQAAIVAGLQSLGMKPSEISRDLLLEEIKRRLK
jgi:hypothetical protein